MTDIKELNLDTGQQFGAIAMTEQLNQKEYNHYQHFYLKLTPEQRYMPHFKSKPGIYATAYHMGKESDIGKTYERLKKQLNALNYSFGLYAFEEFIYDSTVLNDEEQYVTKILIHLN